MLYHLLELLEDQKTIRINPFQYITVRAATAGILALLISLLIGPRVVAVLRLLKAGQPIRSVAIKGAPDLAEMHGKKAGTPTMGGVLMITALLVPVFLCCNLTNPFIWLLVFVAIGFGTIGFLDDFLKITKKNADGLKPIYKIVGQVIMGTIIGGYLYYFGSSDPLGPVYVYQRSGIPSEPVVGYSHLLIPFVKWWYPAIGLLFIPYAIIVLTGASNAVNLTDGLDGLCVGISAIVTAAFMIITYLASNKHYAEYLMLPYVPLASEVVVFLGALIGALLGFLWFNAYPADMFMGDTGSLTLGGIFGTVALLSKHEITFIIIGGVFVLEAVSVILQVAVYKMTRKRLFLMAPLHHHYERRGLPESKIINRLWIVGILLALIGLSSLKLR